ncbi:MAG: hypothetical protein WBE26_05960 [Phycisphaerae bacterium]
MKTLKRIGKGGVGVVVVVGLLLKCGCGSNDFLGLEDYQRDLLFGGLAVALLAQQAGGTTGDEVPGAPLDGRDGIDGVNCWDLNANGEGDPGEDVNGDGVFDALDCQGPVGPAGQDGADGQDGAPGSAGADGQNGADGQDGAPGATGAAGRDGSNGSNGSPGANGLDGLSCWDLNGNGFGDPEEDTNGDGLWNAWDCAGAGSLFDIFIEEFFGPDGAPRGDMSVHGVPIVQIDTPVLGARDPATGVDGVIAYRVAIPNIYDADNDVTMRLFFYRTGTPPEDCFEFTVDRARLRNGQVIERYTNTRWVTCDPQSIPDKLGPTLCASDVLPGDGTEDGVAVVVDLPVNRGTADQDGRMDGLGFWIDDLLPADLLAFELAADGLRFANVKYQLLGVEFFESAPGTATVRGALIFDSNATSCYECIGNELDCNENGTDDNCDILYGLSEDCNENGIPDECDIWNGTSEDCNKNGIPDECDIADGTSEDTNENGIPDECEEECICHEDVVASCQMFVGPIHGPDGVAAFDAWIGAYGGHLIDFESLPTGTNLRDQLAGEFGVHFASISDTSGNPAGPYHVEVSGEHPNTAYGNTIVGSPCDPNCWDDGRVEYEATFDEPQRWVGIERLWLTWNTITQFYSGATLIYEYEDAPCYESWAPYFFGYVVDSDDPGTWITRIVMSGKPPLSRQVGYSDNLRFGTAMFEEPPRYGAFVCYQRPAVDGDCEFTCLDNGDTASGQGASVQCRVLCDPPTDLFYPVGDTTVTCTAERREYVEAPWVPTDECTFTISVLDNCVDD